MAKVVFENLTLEQAKTFASWFEGQGEQDCCVWFEENKVDAPLVDVVKPNWITVDEQNQTVTVLCRFFQ